MKKDWYQVLIQLDAYTVDEHLFLEFKEAARWAESALTAGAVSVTIRKV